MERIDKILTSLGYGSRKEVQSFIKRGHVSIEGIVTRDVKLKANHENIRFDGEMLDSYPLIIAMNKPANFVCSHNDSGKLIYSLLPQRWQQRNPKISTIGRLDSDTTGIILLTDDGELNHTLTSPKKHIKKIYKVTLAMPLNGNEADIFASGGLMLRGEDKPCLSARLTVVDDFNVYLELIEGRYHQVKRMFGAVGNKVVRLHREQFANIRVDDLKEGEHRVISKEDILFI